MRPTAAAVASLNWPSKHDASFEPLSKCLKTNIHAASSHVYPLNSPTRFREDPFNLRGLVKAEVLTDATEQADALLAAGYKDPACVVAGISLEVAIKEIAIRNGLVVGKLDKMNADLCKLGIYNVAKQKQVTAWADLRNKAAHGDWAEYNDADVRDMLSGIERFIADYL